ncbi:hypothetical protein [Latilactobacillus graminis]|uniref:Uncharacterized protein n=2 Tax=Latilactobacillus graminis TaxID=60519 RepID=A0AA89HZZ8_9LACO|nr:hypothetical protein [Latilactobacillus graminis]KRM21218.1 hypothetical protein FC90_GL001755 [Latilactobacillus graminis DSM 20719]QFP79343.1 hypothetical protein LG542_03465 [Latilactobacillus graminis]
MKQKSLTKKPAVALLNAVLMLSLVTSALLIITNSYQQQQRSYLSLSNYYQVQTLLKLTLQERQKKPINGIRANTGKSRIDHQHKQIIIELRNGYQKQFPDEYEIDQL